MPSLFRSFQRIKLILIVLFTISFLPLFIVFASHLPPTVRDYSMGTIAGAQRELSIAVNPNNPDILAAGANDRPGTQRWYTSTDGGRNWTSGALPNGTLTVVGTTSTAMSDPSLDFGNNGQIYYSALMHGGLGEPCTLFVSVSQDLGTNWTDPANGVVAAGTTGPVVCQDKEHILVDRLNNDNVYVAWTPIGGALNREAVFSRDLNGITDGLAFSAPTVLSTGAAQNNCLNQGADLAEDAAGTLYIVWTSFCSGFANGDPGTVFVVRSTDQGGTWSAPVEAATLDNANPAVDPSFRSRSFPSIDVDQATGRVFIVYATNANAAANTDPDIMIVSSPNGTAGSWTTPIRVNQDVGTTEQVLPWLDVGNGRIHVAFSSRAGDGSNWTTRVAHGATSASPTFTEITVSGANTPPGTGFIGDYHGAFVGTDDVLHPAWGDGRIGVSGATDAFTARVNFSPPTTLTLLPLAPTEVIGVHITFVATVTGSHGEVETFIPVTFTVISTGSPSSTGTSGLTNTSGQVNFTYTNTVVGVDTLHVFADFDEDGIEDIGETSDTTVTWKPVPADLSITKADAPDPVMAGGTLTYTITVTNNGPGDATGVKVNDTLPPGVTLVSASADQGTCTPGAVVTCDIGDVLPGDSVTITIEVTIDPTTPSGLITNTATVTGNEDDPDTTNNTASIETMVIGKCIILDDFNRPDGPLGSNWAGRIQGYRIRDNHVVVQAGGPIYWQPESYGPNQEACVTLTRINPKSRQHALLLKVRELNDLRKGAILVSYNARAGNVEVKTRDVPNHKWILIGSFTPPTSVVDGDQLRALAFADGTVEVFINDISIGKADAGGFYADNGGQIGLWVRGGQGSDDDNDDDDDRLIQEDLEAEKGPGARRAFLDDFGGGNITAP